MSLQLIEGVANNVILFIGAIVTGLGCIFVIQRRHSSMQQRIHPDARPALRNFRANVQHQEWRSAGLDDDSTTSPASVDTSMQPPPLTLSAQRSDQICPICLDSPPSVEVTTNCGHSFCGECILEFWRHKGSPLGTLPCPCCRTPLTMLHGASANVFQERHGSMIQNQVNHFNRTCSTRSRTWCEMFHDAPILIRLVIANPTLLCNVKLALYFILLVVCTCMYFLSPIDVIPEVVFGVFGLVDDGVVGLVAFIIFSEIVRRAVVSSLQVSTVSPPTRASAATQNMSNSHRRAQSRQRTTTQS
jgi:RING finger protein 170